MSWATPSAPPASPAAGWIHNRWNGPSRRRRPLATQVQELAVNRIHIFGLAVRRQAHDLVLARVHFESGEIGECRVQQAERVWPVQFPEELEIIAATDPPCRGGPLTNAVYRENRGF